MCMSKLHFTDLCHWSACSKTVSLHVVISLSLLHNYSLSILSPLQKVLYTLSVNVLEVMCRVFYKQSMVHSEVRKLCIHPTWFIWNKDLIINVFYKMKQNLLYYFSCLCLRGFLNCCFVTCSIYICTCYFRGLLIISQTQAHIFSKWKLYNSIRYSAVQLKNVP